MKKRLMRDDLGGGHKCCDKPPKHLITFYYCKLLVHTFSYFIWCFI